MKKTVLLLTVCMLTLAAAAQPAGHVRKDGHHINRVEKLAAKNGNPWKMSGYYTDDYYEFESYDYDNRSRLIAVSDSVVGEYFVIDSLFYNDRDQMVRLSGWQLLDGALKNVYYVEYTYDAAGNIASRTNYNMWEGEWCLGGVYNYTYNADNQIVLSTLDMGGMRYQKVEYTYDAGLLMQELWYSYDGVGLTPSDKINYTYDSDRHLLREDDSTSYDGYHWAYYGYRTYVYDEYGNCLIYEYVDNTGSPSERREYQYDYSMPLNQVLMPWTPEMERPYIYQNVHAYTTESWYAVDIDHVLQYVCDYIYLYDENTAGIADVRKNEMRMEVSPNPANDFVTIEGVGDTRACLSVYDAMGRKVMSAIVSNINNTIDISKLSAGNYLFCLTSQKGVSTSKVIVK